VKKEVRHWPRRPPIPEKAQETTCRKGKGSLGNGGNIQRSNRGKRGPWKKKDFKVSTGAHDSDLMCGCAIGKSKRGTGELKDPLLEDSRRRRHRGGNEVVFQEKKQGKTRAGREGLRT